MQSHDSVTDCHPEGTPEGSCLAPSSQILREYAQDDKWVRWCAPAIIFAYAFRLLYCWWRQLVPDEAVYWTWSRHLDLSYFDHPPMIAYLIRAGTAIFGSTELGVRFGSATLAMTSILILIALVKRIYDDAVCTALVALIWIVSPLLAGIATISTPDAPATFFSMSAMAAALMIVRSDSQASRHIGGWMLFGLLCGLALLSKYTTILLPCSVFLALLFSRTGRAHLRQPGIYLAAIIAVVVFSPVIIWNWRHDWAPFRFQLVHGLGAGHRAGWAMFLEWLGGQGLIVTPVLFVLLIGAVAISWRNARLLHEAEWILLWCATVPLVFFGYAATRSRGEPNWPAFAYFPASLLLASLVSRSPAGWLWQWMKIGCIVALGGFLIVQFPEVAWALRIPVPTKMDELVGWREFGLEVAAAASGAPVIANRHQIAAEAAFYMPGQPDVWASSVGSRPTAFDYMRGAPNIRMFPNILFLGSNVDEFCHAYGFAPEKGGMITINLPSGRTRTREWTMMHKREESP